MALDAAAEDVLKTSREMDLTTTGRRTGLPRTVELWFAYRDGCIYLLSGMNQEGRPTHWYRNLQANPRATIRVRGMSLSARLEPFREPEAAKALVVELFRGKYGPQVMSTWYRSGRHLPVQLRLSEHS